MSQSSGLGQFTRLPSAPANVSEAGSTVDELKLQVGNPDPNPVANPMLSPDILTQALKQVGTPKTGSDTTRLSTPPPPAQDAAPTSDYRLAQVYSALKKLDPENVGSVMQMVNNAVPDPVMKRLMGDSAARVDSLVKMLDMFAKMTTHVDTRRAGASKA